MIEAHTLDSWTQAADRGRAALQMGDRRRRLRRADVPVSGRRRTRACRRRSPSSKGLSDADVLGAARRRGWQIFGLAFLFRLQSAVLGGGGVRSLLKVDILNVMGLSMVVTAVLWGLGRRTAARVLVLVTAARRGGDADADHPCDDDARLAARIRSRPTSGRSPRQRVHAVSMGWIRARRCGDRTVARYRANAADERRVIIWLAWLGPVLVARRVCVVAAAADLPGDQLLDQLTDVLRAASRSADRRDSDRVRLDSCGSRPFADSGARDRVALRLLDSRRDGLRRSDWPIHRRLAFEQALVAFAVFTRASLRLVRLKDRVLRARRRASGRSRLRRTTPKQIAASVYTTRTSVRSEVVVRHQEVARTRGGDVLPCLVVQNPAVQHRRGPAARGAWPRPSP